MQMILTACRVALVARRCFIPEADMSERSIPSRPIAALPSLQTSTPSQSRLPNQETS